MFRIEFKMRKISETLYVFKKYNDRSAKKISHVTSLDVTAKIAGDKKIACSVCMEEQELEKKMQTYQSHYLFLGM